MISLSKLNKLIKLTIFFTILIFNSVFAATAIDIWENKQKQNEQTNEEKDIIIKTPILIEEDVNKISIQINEEKISKSDQTIIGILDPIENNFNINMWSQSDGQDITNTRFGKGLINVMSKDSSWSSKVIIFSSSE